tara:strand:- start:125 stop:577 length:453 start_codon:yes stop_codon:yes gene_type:complete
MNSVAIWPFELSKFSNKTNPKEIVDMSGKLSGVVMDQTLALQMMTNINFTNDSFSRSEDSIKRWAKWHSSGGSTSNPFVKMISPKDYRKFLISQNTLASLEEVLYSYPMDKEVLSLYSMRLDNFAKDETVEQYKKERFRVSAKWYQSISN